MSESCLICNTKTLRMLHNNRVLKLAPSLGHCLKVLENKKIYMLVQSEPFYCDLGERTKQWLSLNVFVEKAFSN